MIEHINLYPGCRLVDSPAAQAGLTQRKKLVARIIENQRCEGIQVQAGFHKRGISDQHLKAMVKAILHPVLPGLRFHFCLQDRGVPAALCHKLQEPLWSIQTGPVCINEHLPAGRDFFLRDFQHHLILRHDGARRHRVLGFDNIVAIERVLDCGLAIGLVWMSGQKIHI